MAGKPAPAVPERLKQIRDARKKREEARRARGVDIDAVHRKIRPPEKHVLAAVLKALRHDPRVASVERTQSGLFQEGNRWIRVGTPGKLDITGLLVGGRYFEIEVKRPGEKPNPKQADRIAAIRANGGISGYAWSAESALALLP